MYELQKFKQIKLVCMRQNGLPDHTTLGIHLGKLASVVLIQLPLAFATTRNLNMTVKVSEELRAKQTLRNNHIWGKRKRAGLEPHASHVEAAHVVHRRFPTFADWPQQ